jgi:hypothetical protein
MVVVLGFLLTMLIDFSNQRTRQSLNVIGQSAVQQIESDVKLASAYMSTIDTNAFADSYGADNSTSTTDPWDFKAGAQTPTPYRSLILQTYATDSNPLSDVRNPVFVNSEGCTGNAKYANEVLKNTVIYYVLNDTLYRRVLTSPLTTCTPPFQVQTCPSSKKTSWDLNVCRTDDTALVTNITAFNIEYYSTSIASAPVDVYTSPELLDTVVAVRITFTHNQPGTSQTNSVDFRVTRIN